MLVPYKITEFHQQPTLYCTEAKKHLQIEKCINVFKGAKPWLAYPIVKYLIFHRIFGTRNHIVFVFVEYQPKYTAFSLILRFLKKLSSPSKEQIVQFHCHPYAFISNRFQIFQNVSISRCYSPFFIFSCYIPSTLNLQSSH